MGSWSGIFRKQKFKCSLCPGEDSPLIHTARSIDKCFARLREWYLKVLLLQVETDAHVKRQEQTLYGYIPYSGYDLFPSIGLYFSEKRLTSIKIIKRYICSSMIDKEATYACLRF